MRRRRLSREEYVAGVVHGDRAVLARAITLIESHLAADIDLAQQVLDDCLPHTGKSVRLGITGVPGVGKSTFVEALGTHLTRERGEKVAVLSVDPSSPLSGGSILGDKTRMERLANDDLAFVRPSPSRGHLGGVTRRTREALLLCEAAGYRNIFVETVGVGQSETAVRGMVDFFLLLLLAGAGDELQGIKRGIMELTDLIAINKADGENRLAAERARQEYASALHLFPAAADGWTPRATTCSAMTGDGIVEIWQAILEHRALTEANGWLGERRRRQARDWMHELILTGLEDQFRRDRRVSERLPKLEQDVLTGKVSSLRAARELLSWFHHRKD